MVTGHERLRQKNQFDLVPTKTLEIIKESSELPESNFVGVKISEGNILTPNPHRKIEIKKVIGITRIFGVQNNCRHFHDSSDQINFVGEKCWICIQLSKFYVLVLFSTV